MNIRYVFLKNIIFRLEDDKDSRADYKYETIILTCSIVIVLKRFILSPKNFLSDT